MSSVITHSEEETIELGKRFAGKLKKGDLVALYGDLGSGKTQLIKGICSGLDVIEDVTSPTFTLMNIYKGKEKIFHYDFYRLSTDSEIYDLGIDDFIFSDGICLIEWAEKAERFLPLERIDVKFDYGDDENERIINFPLEEI
jgi:tRNA threonylcarbamoyladenosine biosynthesis protein TsaE